MEPQMYPPMETAKPELLGAAVELYSIIQERRKIERREAALKSLFAEILPKGGSLRCGDYTVTVTPEERVTISRELAQKIIGDEMLKNIERVSNFLKVGVIKGGVTPKH